jgi:hypothetical protein
VEFARQSSPIVGEVQSNLSIILFEAASITEFLVLHSELTYIGMQNLYRKVKQCQDELPQRWAT